MPESRVKNNGRVWPWIVAGIVLALAVGIGAYLFFIETRHAPVVPSAEFQSVTSVHGPKVNMTLYFPSKDDTYLHPERRDLAEKSGEAEQVRVVVEELIRGPVSGLIPSFPPVTRVKGVFIEKGTAYVNFSRELQSEYPGGAWTETLTIYSLANTLSQNFADIKSVQIMVEGNAVESIAGHIDVYRPVAPKPAMNKE